MHFSLSILLIEMFFWILVYRWYRSPELLFGARSYTGAVDIWAAGCIFAELMLRLPYMAGETDFEQLEVIFKALGTPNEEEWPGHKKLNDYYDLKPIYPKQDLKLLFTAAPNNAIELLQKCLLFNPKKRITAHQALKHPYFHTNPLPTHPAKLPKPNAELVPRRTPGEEVNVNGNNNGMTNATGNKKRKSEVADGDMTGSRASVKVARKLTFD